MTVPQQLSNGAAHGIANGDDLVEPEFLQKRSTIVGAIGQPEPPPRPDPPAVTTVINRHHAEVFGQRLEHLEPVQAP